MPTPIKPLQLMKKHLTVDEKETRAQAENDLLTGKELEMWPEVRSNPIANKRFTAICENLKSINKNDALYEPVINRYCLIHAETYQLDQLRHTIASSIRELNKRKSEMEFVDYLAMSSKLTDQLFACDRSMTTKRKMLLDIEKENIMTIASALRSIPKKPVEDPAPHGMAEFLQKRGGQ